MIDHYLSLKSTRTVIHCFVYEGDSDIIEETVLCAHQALPEAHIVIIDDSNNPCLPDVRSGLRKLGIEWRESAWSRGGNLRGRECIIGILDEMLCSMQHEDDILIKLDADTCLMNGDDFRKFALDSDKVMCAAGELDIRIFGMCYGNKGYALAKARDYLSGMELSDYVAEDVIIGFTLSKLYPEPEFHSIFKTDEKGTKWTAYNWWCYPDVDSYKKSSVITTGNPIPPPLDTKQRKVIMKKLRIKALEYLGEQATRKS